jgi:hypothetical protein
LFIIITGITRSICTIAFKRAFLFMRKAIHQRRGLVAAIEMIRSEKTFKLSNMTSGRFVRIVKVFSFVFPSAIGGFLLWSGLKVISILKKLVALKLCM